MAAVIPGVYTGTAPEASYWLLRSEITSSETKLEEALWIMAAEFADSVGVDIINSSLGYTTFDDPSMNYSYQDLDGTKSLITTAAEIAFSRGMLVVSSAGNEGNKKWRYISAPADGEHVLTVGAIDTALEIAAFSSIGPAADGRIKPDIVALGSNLRVINTSGVPVPGYGTSFSSPLIAGMAACLWQSSPLKTNREIVDAIKTTASRAMNPDNIYGYGIPNFMLALRKLKSAQVPTIDKGVLVFPNPFSEAVEIDFINIPSNVERVSIYSSEGKIVYSKTGNVGNFGYITLDSSDIPEPGLYLLVVYAGNDIFTSKLIRQE
jgi:subtilisin family serine protease